MKSPVKLKLVLIFALLSIGGKSSAEVTLVEQNNWKITTNGFIENDLISDSTRSFREIIGNNPVAAPNSYAGSGPRFQDSIRNSRLAFTILPPEVADWKSRAYFEFDLSGLDPQPNTASNTESGFYNNATMRVRHAYIKAENSGWEILAGQTWELFGFQPFYFIPSVNVAPVPAMTYIRAGQVRGTKNWTMGDSKLISSIAVVKPIQADTAMPDLQAGLRFTFGGRGAGYMAGGASSRKVEQMSVAVSGLAREVSVPTSATDSSYYTASAVSANIFVPILATDDKNVSNTLSLIGSFTSGSGYGDQFNGFTGGTASTLLASSNNNGRTAPLAALDGGIGDYDAGNTFNLIQLTTFNVNLQYHLPSDMPDWVSVGLGVLRSNNMNSLVAANGGTSNSATTKPYDRERIFYGNYFHEFTPQIRVGAEYDYIDTEYSAGAIVAKDNRYLISTYLIF